MSPRVCFASLGLVVLLTACSKAPRHEAAAEPEKVRPPIDACTLLTSEEIKSVQGEAVQETKPSNSSGGAYYAAQCYFATPTNTNSVVVTITQQALGPGGKNPRESWKQIFHRDELDEKEREHGREEEEEKRSAPLEIKGLGDEAFWSANPVGGALYVLKGNIYLRISTGGTNQLDKTKRLAELALKHL